MTVTKICKNGLQQFKFIYQVVNCLYESQYNDLNLTLNKIYPNLFQQNPIPSKFIQTYFRIKFSRCWNHKYGRCHKQSMCSRKPNFDVRWFFLLPPFYWLSMHIVAIESDGDQSNLIRCHIRFIQSELRSIHIKNFKIYAKKYA